jgi:hypothetical protein
MSAREKSKYGRQLVCEVFSRVTLSEALYRNRRAIEIACMQNKAVFNDWTRTRQTKNMLFYWGTAELQKASPYWYENRRET